MPDRRDKQGKDAGNRTLCPYRNFSQAIMMHINGMHMTIWNRLYFKCIANWILVKYILNAVS